VYVCAVDNGVCANWNNFAKIVECTLKPGAAVIVGATQSATCYEDIPAGPACPSGWPADWKQRYGATSYQQVYIFPDEAGAKSRMFCSTERDYAPLSMTALPNNYEGAAKGKLPEAKPNTTPKGKDRTKAVGG
jgi:hypothetical protein